jgi:hypothetical protein
MTSMYLLIHIYIYTCTIRDKHKRIRFGCYGSQCCDVPSIKYFDSIHMDFLICDPNYVPTAKLAAAQSNIQYTASKWSDNNVYYSTCRYYMLVSTSSICTYVLTAIYLYVCIGLEQQNLEDDLLNYPYFF